MADTVGVKTTIISPRIWFAPIGTALPALKLGLKEPWPVGWIRIPYTANGCMLTFVNPRVDITADEVGVLESLGSGADTITAALQSRAPDMTLLQLISGLRKAAYAAVTGTTPETTHPEHERFSLDPTAENRFMFGMTGYLRAGGLYPTAREIKFFMYGGQPTANAGWAFRSPRGADSILQPNIELRSLPQPLLPSQLVGTGIQETDDLERSDLFTIKRAA